MQAKKFRVGILGLGAWGFCLARHLALNGHDVIGWSRDEAVLTTLKSGGDHPHLERSLRGLSICLTSNISEVFQGVDCLVESVTTSGLREVMGLLQSSGYSITQAPLVITSKGVERTTHHMPPEIIQAIFGKEALLQVAMLSGPSFAQEVAQGLPTAVVCGSVNLEVAQLVSTLFSNTTFRVYPNEDIIGVSIGGALKNVIAIACGIADGLNLGTGARASLVTRGLHEMVKLAHHMKATTQTLYGLSGLGDLYLTCSSPLSRNFRFGRLLSEGVSKNDAEKLIGMVIEGASTAIAAFELSQQYDISMPITTAVYNVIHGTVTAKDAVNMLMQRLVKEEKL